MRKSDLKLLRERNQRAVMPSVPKKEDVSDELTALFDDGTKLASAPAPGTLGTQSTPTSQPTSLPVAPARDYMKVANSISREAVPAGLFKGKAKQIYDFLYSKTRGAIVPARSVRLTRREIMEGSHIGSTKTLYLNLQHLRAVGLVECQEIVGPHGGNEYTIHLPEEVVAQSTQSTLSTLSTSSDSSPKVVRVLRVESTQSTQSLSGDSKDSYADAKTSFKTKDRSDDDEPLALLLANFEQASRELTGKKLSPAERARWGELAELLVAELKIAAARTGSVSSVPAFLTEHLRRRLWKKDKAQLDREAAIEPDQKQEVDASRCPDCGGSGWWYPDGSERGVAKCKHIRLVSDNEAGK